MLLQIDSYLLLHLQKNAAISGSKLQSRKVEKCINHERL